MRISRIGIVDADPIRRYGLPQLLKQSDLEITVVGVFASLAEVLPHLSAQDNQLNSLLLDDLGAGQGELRQDVRRLLAQHPGLVVIVMSDAGDAGYVQGLFSVGVSGFIQRGEQFAGQVLDALRAVRHGGWYLSPNLSRLVFLGYSHDATTQLTQRDLDVIRRMANGQTVQEIAFHLSVSSQVIYRTRRKLRETLQVQTSEQIVAAALKQGLI
jgi:DNA-binding NarL/FixJ family response regulator